jgi:hypothetical protein
MRCSYFIWRFGQATDLWVVVEKWGGLLIFLSWLFYVFIEKGFSAHISQGSELIDIVFGVPIVVMMGLVGVVIWKGFIRAALCVMGRLRTRDDNE